MINVFFICTSITLQMTDNLAQMFQTMTNQLRNVKDAIEQEYDDFSTTVQNIFPQCCKIKGTYSPKFRTEVNYNIKNFDFYIYIYLFLARLNKLIFFFRYQRPGHVYHNPLLRTIFQTKKLKT